MSARTSTAPKWADFGDADLVADVIAAGLLKLSPFTLRQWRQFEPPRGPRFSRLGNRVVYRVADLQKFVERNAVVTVDDPDASQLRRVS